MSMMDIDTSVPGTRNYRALIADALARASQTYGSGGSLGQAVGAAAVPLSAAAPQNSYNVPGTRNYNPALPATGGDEGFGGGGPQYQIDEVSSDPDSGTPAANTVNSDMVGGPTQGLAGLNTGNLSANTGITGVLGPANSPGFTGFTSGTLAGPLGDTNSGLLSAANTATTQTNQAGKGNFGDSVVSDIVGPTPDNTPSALTGLPSSIDIAQGFGRSNPGFAGPTPGTILGDPSDPGNPGLSTDTGYGTGFGAGFGSNSTDATAGPGTGYGGAVSQGFGYGGDIAGGPGTGFGSGTGPDAGLGAPAGGFDAGPGAAPGGFDSGPGGSGTTGAGGDGGGGSK